MTALSGSLPVHHHRTVCFAVHAAAEPGTMPRVMDVFAKRGLVPSKWLSTITGTRNEEIHIDIQLTYADSDLIERLANSLKQVVSVRSVLTSEKRLLMSA